MYGVPVDLDLSRFEGTLLSSLCLGEFNVSLAFQSPDGSRWLPTGPSLMVEGGWELRDGAGQVVDCSMPNSERDAYKLHRLLGRTVRGFAVDAPESICLVFDNGLVFCVFDDSSEYESFQIQPGDIIV